jgi:hypothetical protein
VALSSAALEVLAIVAYRQPIARSNEGLQMADGQSEAERQCPIGSGSAVSGLRQLREAEGYR